MRHSFGFLLGAVLCSCAGSEPAPTLTVSPSGTVQSAGPTLFTAGPASLAGDVRWGLVGPGSISGTTGATVVYRPATPVDPSQTATLTATAQGQAVTVTIHPQPSPAAVPTGVIPGLHGAVQVTYDAQEIPHVFCSNQLDCFATQGYLHAQDRLFEMDFFRRTARGQLATLLGQAGVSSDEQLLTLLTTRDGKKIEDQLAASLDSATKAVIGAYVSGVNAYLAWLRAHPTAMPGEYAQVAAGMTPNDIPDWTAADTLAFGRLQSLQLSETISEELNRGIFAQVYGPSSPLYDQGKLNAYFNVRQPVASYTLSDTDTVPAARPSIRAPTPSSDLSAWLPGMAAASRAWAAPRPMLAGMGTSAGSNNWVVDAAHSATGHAMVANDPHLALYYPPVWHLSAMTASDSSGLDVVGASFPGAPGPLTGRGAHVAWGVTVVGYDVTDLYLETLTGCSGGQCGAVTFNGGPVPMTLVTYTIKVRGAADVSFPLFVVPHHGPLLMQTYDPAHHSAISVRWVGQDLSYEIAAFYNLALATSVGDPSAAAGTAFAAIKNFGVGAQNFVVGDDKGNIGYDPHALVPQRPWISATKNPGLPLPGDGSAEWGPGGSTNCDGTVTGGNPPGADCWVPDALLPKGTNPAKGYFATANSDPAGFTDDGNPVGNSVGGTLYPYLSFQWSDPTGMRYGRIASLLKAKTAAGKVSIADMEAIQGDHSLLFAKLMLPLFPTTAEATDPKYATALAMLTTWQGDDFDCPSGVIGSDPNGAADTDATHARDSQACMLFHAFLAELRDEVFADDMAVVSKVSGQPFSADGGAEIRALFYMLGGAPAGDTTFCNDVDSSGVPTATHTCKEKVASSLIAAQAMLTAQLGPPANWIWGRKHTLTLKEPAAPLIAGRFQAGPFARPGGIETVDVAQPSLSAGSTDFSYAHGPSIREIMDVTDSAHATMKMQLPGTERDQPFGVFANTPDLIGQYVRNQYFDLPVGHQVDAAAVSSQGFSAP